MDVLYEGLVLSGIGMGVVFTFLAVLVLATSTMSKLIVRYAPQPLSSGPASPSVGSTVDDGELIAVIGAAIHRHRSRH